MSQRMSINPTHLSVGQLFSHNFIFRLPKYQRYYSWTSEEIDDFLKDLDICAKHKEANKPKSHFFGGLVTVDQPVLGSARQNVEVIDGQQRLATFVMFAVRLRQTMKKLSSEDTTPKEISDFLSKKAETLRSQYEEYNDTINLQVVPVPRLELSKPDKTFFSQMLEGINPSIERKSHELLENAFNRMGKHLEKSIASKSTVEEKARHLATLAAVLEEDWTVIHMSTKTRSEAYMLFQVLNDRGMGLTEGELLRAKTLEALDSGGNATQQHAVEQGWDQILSTAPERVEESLRWLYASYKGARPGKATLFDDCLDHFFPMHSELPLSSESAANLTKTVNELKKEFQVINSLLEGEWPYDTASVTKWETDRLRLLTIELKHTNCMPLLVAASKLSQKKFSETIQILEKFVFRYKTIINGHIGPATAIYQTQAIEIRKSPANYTTKNLQKALAHLISSNADDAKFRVVLGELKYSRIASNKPIKYLLMTLEHYHSWYASGAKGKPNCKDKSRVFDFSNGTIEHIYPANANPKDPALEPLVDTLGNLTYLGLTDNDAVGNKLFSEKKSIFEKSSILLNRTVAANMTWDEKTIDEHKKLLIDMAVKVFSL